ncbi:zinc finger protein 704-like isoform X2 [Gigantopelta aegis]|uniref:zinc finger protein 704-like isoform X2 n=1 Tax=Gigantopelta aegis TaxID=1735272 RepID=UPI001B88DA2C|nr:zinc finger protein 704-like isoform X2 [Gigantopelta aegis]
MFSNRRLAKRSIVGTRVCALWQDGRYYPGVIEAQSSDESMFTCAMFIVKFDDGYQKDIPGKFIIGPGFQSGPTTQLKHGQKVYLTLHGREVSGIIITQDDDSVLINVRLQTGQEDQMIRKVDDVRLLESRKSARLVDQETDYSKLNDLSFTESSGKKRTVSHVIDVPTKAPRHRLPRDPVDADLIEDTEMVSEETDMVSDDTDVASKNSETMAAIALTNLSCSPASPTFPSSFKEKEFHTPPVAHPCPEGFGLSCSTTSSGFGSGNSERNEYSPPLPFPLSESAPAAVGRDLPFSPDEGVDLEEETTDFYNEQQEELKRTVYQCTWRKCGHTDRSYTDVARHVRKTHLQRDSDSELSDEEEFYIDDVVVGSVDTMTKQFAEMHTSSPPVVRLDITPTLKSFDHDYLKKDNKCIPMASSVPTENMVVHPGSTSSPIPIAIPEGQIKRSLSWQVHSVSPANSISQPIRMNRPTAQERLHQHQAQSPKTHVLAASPKGNIIHRKPRSEVRKCRKVYGMEKRDMWCTQCKWKKACTRFLD